MAQEPKGNSIIIKSRIVESRIVFSFIVHKLITFLEALGEIFLIYFTVLSLLFHGRVSIKRIIIEMNNIGVNSLPIVTVITSFAGMVFSLHLSELFAIFGLNSQMGHFLALAFSRELAPVLTGVVVAGRAGSAIAAEIGSMSVTEQLDALKSLSTDPRQYLIAPKIIAAFFMLPVLIIVANLCGLLGGLFLALYFKTITIPTFTDSILTSITIWDFVGGLVKGFFFGLIISGIGTYYGLHTKNGAVGVGYSTTKAVVTATIFLFTMNYFLSAILYGL